MKEIDIEFFYDKNNANKKLIFTYLYNPTLYQIEEVHNLYNWGEDQAIRKKRGAMSLLNNRPVLDANLDLSSNVQVIMNHHIHGKTGLMTLIKKIRLSSQNYNLSL